MASAAVMPAPRDPMIDSLERIRTLVVDPIVAELKAELVSVRRELVAQGERFERSHMQLERSLTQTEAMIRSAHDPQTGNITRPELWALKEAADKERDIIRRSISEAATTAKSARTELEKSMRELAKDHEDRLRLIESNSFPTWIWPCITTIGACVAALTSHFVWK